MDRQLVEKELITIHTDLERDMGHETTVTSATNPLDDLEGFDSPLIPNVVRTLSRRLGVEPPTGSSLKNIYVSADRKRRLDIAEVAERFCTLYGAEAA